MSASKKWGGGCCCKKAKGRSGGGLTDIQITEIIQNGGVSLWELFTDFDGVIKIRSKLARQVCTSSQFRIIVPSDKNLKFDISPLDASSKEIDEFFKIEAVKFKYKDKEDLGLQYGFLAQDIKKITGLENITKIVDKEGHLGIDVLQIIPLLFTKIQQLEERVKELEN